MDTAIQQFSFGHQQTRIVLGDDGEPRWVAKDVADTLGYVWKGVATIAHVPGEWRGVYSVQTPSGTQDMLVLSEPGLWFFLGRSDKPKALDYQKWLASEVMPALRKRGSYVVPGREPSAFDVLEQMFATIKELRGEFGELRYDVCEVRRDVDEIKAAQGKAETRLLPAQTSDTGYRTVVGYANMHGIRITNETAKEYGHLAAEWSRKHGYPIDKVPDARFGKVNAYHIDALDWAFGNGN